MFTLSIEYVIVKISKCKASKYALFYYTVQIIHILLKRIIIIIHPLSMFSQKVTSNKFNQNWLIGCILLIVSCTSVEDIFCI